MKKRWESYVMYRQNKRLVEFWKEYYKDRPAVKVLFLLGKGFDPRKLLAPGAEAIKATVREKMELFGSVGKA